MAPKSLLCINELALSHETNLILFRDGDLNGFQDRYWAISDRGTVDGSLGVTLHCTCLITRNMKIFGLGMGMSMVFKILDHLH